MIDDYQGQGVGTLLMRHLAIIARAAGLKELIAEVLPENSAMRKVFGKFGFQASPRTGPRCGPSGAYSLKAPRPPPIRGAMPGRSRQQPPAARSGHRRPPTMSPMMSMACPNEVPDNAERDACTHRTPITASGGTSAEGNSMISPRASAAQIKAQMLR